MFERIKKHIRRFINNERAVSAGEVVTLAVSFFLVAILGPIALGEVANASTVNWEASVVTMFQIVLPILWVIGVAIKYIPRGK